jgi:hypothetical protein
MFPINLSYFGSINLQIFSPDTLHIVGDQIVSVQLMITIYKFASNVHSTPAFLQTFIDTGLTLTPSVIPNSNYVSTVSDLNCINYCLRVFTVIIRWTEISWSSRVSFSHRKWPNSVTTCYIECYSINSIQYSLTINSLWSVCLVILQEPPTITLLFQASSRE